MMSFDESWWGTLGAEIFKQVKAKDNLIIELADALESSASHDTDWARQSTYLEIVQRAREAAK
jgi:hypothetical protein